MEAMINELDITVEPAIVENLFAFSCIWAFGGCLIHEEKAKFSERFLDTFKKYKPIQDKSQKELTVFDFAYAPLAPDAKPGPDGKKPSEFSVSTEFYIQNSQILHKNSVALRE